MPKVYDFTSPMTQISVRFHPTIKRVNVKVKDTSIKKKYACRLTVYCAALVQEVWIKYCYNLCSFAFRYAVSVLWVLDVDYNVVKTWFGRTVIRSSYKLFYEVSKLYAGYISVWLCSIF